MTLSLQAMVYPAHFSLSSVIRPNILTLTPYRCARDDYNQGILLDANENAFGSSISPASTIDSDFAQDIPPELLPTLSLDLHRYPDPSHPVIKSRIASLRELPSPDYVFLGVGSDEIIDLLMRVCVVPGKEKIMTTPPTYGMYAVCAQVNDVGVVKVLLELSGAKGEGGEEGRFSIKIDEIKKRVVADPSIKLIFLCSPGNPTGTLIPLSSIRSLLEFPDFKGIVVVDEAYIDFANNPEKESAVTLVKEYANICVMQTLSKSFGLAAIRLGIALAQPALIQILSNTKAPYNISTPTAHLALSALSPESVALMQNKVNKLVQGRKTLLKSLELLGAKGLGIGKSIGGNDANFVVIPLLERTVGESIPQDAKPDSVRAHKVYKFLAESSGLVVRYRGNEPGCEGCLRITIGTEEENIEVIKKLEEVLRAI